jgi:hypothetical protein
MWGVSKRESGCEAEWNQSLIEQEKRPSDTAVVGLGVDLVESRVMKCLVPHMPQVYIKFEQVQPYEFILK